VLRRLAGALLGPLARELTGGRPRILFYHRFSPGGFRALRPDDLEAQLAFLRRHFAPVPLARIVDAKAGGAPLPRRAVAITVDDGYRDFVDHAYPLLQRYEVPATFYVVSGFAAGRLWLWFDRLRYVCEHAAIPVLAIADPAAAGAYPLATPADRERTWDRLATRCLTLPTAAREALIAEAARIAEVTVPAGPPPGYAAASFPELARLDPALVEIGAHTVTHPILSQCDDAEVELEVGGSVRELATALGRPIRAFCYPNGRPEDFDGRAVAAVAAAGCTSATASTGMFVPAGADRYTLPRFGAASERSTFRHELDGLTYLQARLGGRRHETLPGEIAGRGVGHHRP
jgi:peptidoglycan/xylan/chitin deacetylase (PgdA/CDA1 family)